MHILWARVALALLVCHRQYKGLPVSRYLIRSYMQASLSTVLKCCLEVPAFPVQNLTLHSS